MAWLFFFPPLPRERAAKFLVRPLLEGDGLYAFAPEPTQAPILASPLPRLHRPQPPIASQGKTRFPTIFKAAQRTRRGLRPCTGENTLTQAGLGRSWLAPTHPSRVTTT